MPCAFSEHVVLLRLQACDPRAAAPAAGGNNTLTATMAFEEQEDYSKYKKVPDVMFSCGTVQPRDDGPPEEVTADASGNSNSHDHSFDALVFPWLYHGGKGAFRSGEVMSTFPKERMEQLLSPFAMMKEYLLVMYQVRCLGNLHVLCLLYDCIGIASATC